MAAGAAVLILSGLLWNSDRKLTNSQETVADQKTEIKQLKGDLRDAAAANLMTRESLELCKEVNQENADARDFAFLVASIAAGEADILRSELEIMLNETEIEIPNTECMADPYPDDFVRQLCVESGANCPG